MYHDAVYFYVIRGIEINKLPYNFETLNIIFNIACTSCLFLSKTMKRNLTRKLKRILIKIHFNCFKVSFCLFFSYGVMIIII